MRNRIPAFELRIAGVLAMALLAACNSEESEPGPSLNDASVSPEGGAEAATEAATEAGPDAVASGDCAAFCGNVTKSACYVKTTCLSECEQTAAVIPSKNADCQAAWGPFLSCMAQADPTTFVCSSFVPAVSALACRVEVDHYYLYCVDNGNASIPCNAMPSSYDAVCSGSTPKPMNCPGAVPAGCVVGGGAKDLGLYCCP